ncbi:MAG: hypothetical protein UT22_C0006G0009 [Parcubacteria group bacterium GW2011_GWC2_39_11]|nr:MAG: hypothetical protein US88_C0006G0010 [Parcubacteria group bacterium GW2011_GWA2_38_27]KKQ97928.1 MAG: hypothetical protein UT22_C0006G0009 [Parcubacteria group bacterium GW2011_GWC2_39_11]
MQKFSKENFCPARQRFYLKNFCIGRHRLTVRTPPLQGGNTGPTPVGAAIDKVSEEVYNRSSENEVVFLIRAFS